MSTGRFHKRHAFLALPLTLAVLLVSMCVPLTCSAATMATGNCPDCASTPMHAGAPMSPMHSQSAPVQPCNHAERSTVQASTSDIQVRFTQLSTPAVLAPVTVSPIRVAAVVQERPAEPPGILLTASQLRI